MDINELIAALAEKYGDKVDNDAILSYLGEQGYSTEGLEPELLDDITSAVLELLLSEQAADADAAENPLSLDKVEAAADAAHDMAQDMANEDGTSVSVSKQDSDDDGDIDTVKVKKATVETDDNAQESEDDPHETKLNSNLIDAVDRKY